MAESIDFYSLCMFVDLIFPPTPVKKKKINLTKEIGERYLANIKKFDGEDWQEKKIAVITFARF